MSDDGNSDVVGEWSLDSSKLEHFFRLVLNHHLDGGRQYFLPAPPPLVPADAQQTDTAQAQTKKLEELITLYAPQFAKSSVPFWNPDYIAHTNIDKSMSGIVRYLTALLFNPNNIALEASPLTPILQDRVGTQLCNMVGYNTSADGKPVAWGHFTSGTAVANLESMWAAYNLKFYSLSLRNAMKNELSFVASSFTVPLCGGTRKLLRDFTTWELLNINPSDVLDIPTRLRDSYNISLPFLEDSIKPYLVRSVGKDKLEKDFQINTPISYIASATMDYSWEKSASITGIGAANIHTVSVDNSARMDLKNLEQYLEVCLQNKQAIYAVVATLGSAEHGSCDPLTGIIRIREKYRQKGLSFLLQADAAWGAYFATTCLPADSRVDCFLKSTTIESIRHLHVCDSITLDPHKSGYIQYQAGGLLYRDERMRRLVAWTSPVMFKNESTPDDIYGVEDSPSAAPVTAYFFHNVIGLDKTGYGQLLGQAIFNAVKVYAHLVTTKEPDFAITTLNMLPSEEKGGNVEAEKAEILKLLAKSNSYDIDGDQTLMDLARDIGSDLCINAFIVNFRLNGRLNEDVVEANDLCERIFKRLSVSSHVTDLTTLPLILTSTRLAQRKYGSYLTNLKNRSGLKGDQDLFVLLHVATSPIPTANHLLAEIASSLRQTINEECQISKYRNTVAPDIHRFIMQGTDTIFFVYLSMFNKENHRSQLVITGDVPNEIKAQYVRERARDPAQVFTLATESQETLGNILQRKDFRAVIHKGVPDPDDLNGNPIIKGFKLSNIRVLVQRPLNTKYLVPYPHLTMPFFVYGTARQWHLNHVYTGYPNVHLSADQVEIQGYTLRSDGAIYAHLNYMENTMQPFDTSDPTNFFFRSGATLASARFTSDLDGTRYLGDGTIKLTKNVYVDAHWLNLNPVPGGSKVAARTGQDWNDIIDGIEKEISERD